MYNKRSLASEDIAAIPDEKRFRHDMVDVFLNNELSSARSARLLHNAAMAGARHVQDLQVNQSGSNAQRDLLRKCFRNSKWPSVYEFSVPGWNQAKQCEQQHQLAMLLPHELLHAFLKLNSAETMLANQRNVLPERPDLLSHLAQLQQMGLNPDELLLTGIWSDGVPFNSDRSQTLETISLNIFGDDSARLPLTAFPKEFLHKKKTFECIFEVLQWSYKILLGGVFPSCRHDGQPFTNSDSYRRKLAHKTIGIKACLAEFRADWACYKDVLDFPSWASTGYICWQCNVPKADLKKFDSHTFAKYLWAHSNSSNCFV